MAHVISLVGWLKRVKVFFFTAAIHHLHHPDHHMHSALHCRACLHVCSARQEAWPTNGSFSENNGFADSEDNLQNEEVSGRNPCRRLAKHISLEAPRQQPGAFPPLAQSLAVDCLEPSRQHMLLPDWAAMNLQMQKLQVTSLLVLHKSAVCCL